MAPIPKIIETAKLLSYTFIDERHQVTGKTHHSVHGTLIAPAKILAICQYDDDTGFYLFYCDENWQVLTDTWHTSLSEAKKQAEFEYVGTASTWITVSS